MYSNTPSSEMKVFMLALADLLEEHDATIGSAIKYTDHGPNAHQVELWCDEPFDTERDDIDEVWLRKRVKEG